MADPDVKRKLIGILIADVKGYSRLMADNEKATVEILTAYRYSMDRLIQEHRGRVVDAIGDNLLAEFSSVVGAVQCAVEIQEDLKGKNADLPANRRMEFRIGVNLGDVIEGGESIYGDGVNIAARLESLSEAGGICISGSAFDQVETKLSLGYEYMGEQRVKNIPKPVRVYRVLVSPKASGTVIFKNRKDDPRHRRRAILTLLVILIVAAAAAGVWRYRFRTDPHFRRAFLKRTQPFELPDKPSIAVLPFVNMSGDAEQEYFSDGLTEDLITDLSKVSGLFVISRNSVFRYKGKSVKPERVSRELGVRYLLEGSVRKAGDSVRITAQLIDATTGGHLWAERYDRELRDILTVQDEVAQQIVTALATQFPDAAISSSGSSPGTADTRPAEAETRQPADEISGDLRAYDYWWRGRWYLQQFTQEGNDQARAMFEKAVELDPQLAAAYMGLGWTYYNDWSMQWSNDPHSLERAFELVEKSLALDNTLSAGHSLLGHIYLWRKEYDKAIAQKERALVLDPNDADAYSDLAEIFVWAGKPEESVELVEKAMRLNPHYPVQYLFTLGFAYLATAQNEEAVEALESAVDQNPDFLGSHILLVFLYMDLNREEEAQAHVAEVRRISPDLSLEVWRQRLPLSDESKLDEVLDLLRKAGLT
jgi:adenylate cyclase